MEDFFQSLADCLLNGDLKAVTDLYTYPLVVYEPNRISIHKSPEETTVRLAERLMALRSGGAVSVRIKLVHAGPKQNNRQPFDVTKTYLDAQGRAIGESRLRYFCRIEAGLIRVELIDMPMAYRINAIPKASAVCH